MHLPKSKKILIYSFLFLLVGTFNNKNFNHREFLQLDNINVIGLDEIDNQKLEEQLDFLKLNNLFFLDKSLIKKVVSSNNLVDEFYVFKFYPSSLEIKIIKTEFLAKVKIKGENLFLGSNGKFIKLNEINKEIPFIFGDFKTKNFFDLKKTIDMANFDYKKIKSLFFFKSGRWDIETYSGLIIKLPNKNLKQSLKLAMKILRDDTQNTIKKIDLRQKNQVILNES